MERCRIGWRQVRARLADSCADCVDRAARTPRANAIAAWVMSEVNFTDPGLELCLDAAGARDNSV